MQHLFTCRPSYFDLSVTITSLGAHVVVKIIVGSFGKKGFESIYTTGKFDENLLHKNISAFFDSLQTCSEKEIHDFIVADNIMAALSVHRSLEEVRTRSGKLVWFRKN